ncbi:DUF29 domain-containing protein [uncultured Thiothrix sp.]|jgi:predicted DNA-binding ribbon-helix-helix protein|uniref:DUF29 domain-containing protein n=1 Tax=uncultured Thiothrix sp. TaxID=223185 RepID=UPI002610D4CC|nr:DUF29 domain-containing protein [uncultured Thiothrix sp.]HRJ94986.1 DUF29 domain-containing protein [Candidatus Thiothrix moscowensis]
MGAVAYENDFYGWALDQADLLRNAAFGKLDITNLVEELQAMSARERRELISRLRVLLMHLLKWKLQPNYPIKSSWETTINNQRDDIALLLEDSPSLNTKIPEALIKAYPMAVREAMQESGLPKSLFPANCPWSYEQIMDNDFWPEPAE